MHAAVVKFRIEDPRSARGELENRVLPVISRAPGFIAAYWTRKESNGFGMTIWESEEDAEAAAEEIRAVSLQGSSLDDVEVREVLGAHA